MGMFFSLGMSFNGIESGDIMTEATCRPTSAGPGALVPQRGDFSTAGAVRPTAWFDSHLANRISRQNCECPRRQPKPNWKTARWRDLGEFGQVAGRFDRIQDLAS